MRYLTVMIGVVLICGCTKEQTQQPVQPEVDATKAFASEAVSALLKGGKPESLAKYFDKDAERKNKGKGSALVSLEQFSEGISEKIAATETIFFTQDDVESLSKRFPDDMWQADRVPAHLADSLGCLCVLQIKGTDQVGLWATVVKKVSGKYKIVYIDDN